MLSSWEDQSTNNKETDGLPVKFPTSLELDCSIVPTCAAWGSAKWDYQRPLKTVGIPTVRHQPAGPIMPFKRKFRIVCCMGGVAAIMGMAGSMKYIYDDNLVWWHPWMDDYLGLDDCAQHEISESFCMT